MKKTKKKAKRKNPTDSTMRNVKADNKRDESLKKRVERLEKDLKELSAFAFSLGNLFTVAFLDPAMLPKPRRGK